VWVKIPVSLVSYSSNFCWFLLFVLCVSIGFFFKLKGWYLFCLFHLQKEDVESALRTSNMNLEDAIELLNQGRLNVEAWRRHEDHSPFDLPSSHPGAGFPGQRFNAVPQQMTFAPPVCCFLLCMSSNLKPTHLSNI
jgi:hypothetical protein